MTRSLFAVHAQSAPAQGEHDHLLLRTRACVSIFRVPIMVMSHSPCPFRQGTNGSLTPTVFVAEHRVFGHGGPFAPTAGRHSPAPGRAHWTGTAAATQAQLRRPRGVNRPPDGRRKLRAGSRVLRTLPSTGPRTDPIVHHRFMGRPHRTAPPGPATARVAGGAPGMVLRFINKHVIFAPALARLTARRRGVRAA